MGSDGAGILILEAGEAIDSGALLGHVEQTKLLLVGQVAGHDVTLGLAAQGRCVLQQVSGYLLPLVVTAKVVVHQITRDGKDEALHGGLAEHLPVVDEPHKHVLREVLGFVAIVDATLDEAEYTLAVRDVGQFNQVFLFFRVLFHGACFMVRQMLFSGGKDRGSF